LKRTHGEEALRYTLLLSLLALAAIFFLIASRTVDTDVGATAR
jgi:hypothetical protein